MFLPKPKSEAVSSLPVIHAGSFVSAAKAEPHISRLAFLPAHKDHRHIELTHRCIYIRHLRQRPQPPLTYRFVIVVSSIWIPSFIQAFPARSEVTGIYASVLYAAKPSEFRSPGLSLLSLTDVEAKSIPLYRQSVAIPSYMRQRPSAKASSARFRATDEYVTKAFGPTVRR